MPVAAFNETKSFPVLCDLGICFPSLGSRRIHCIFFIFQVTPEHFVILKLTYWEKQNKLFHFIFSFCECIWNDLTFHATITLAGLSDNNVSPFIGYMLCKAPQCVLHRPTPSSASGGQEPNMDQISKITGKTN